jgi:hypothetical protein
MVEGKLNPIVTKRRKVQVSDPVYFEAFPLQRFALRDKGDKPNLGKGGVWLQEQNLRCGNVWL